MERIGPSRAAFIVVLLLTTSLVRAADGVKPGKAAAHDWRTGPVESFVTLQLEDVPLERVLREIERQTGNHFDLRPNFSDALDKLVSCNFRKATFWQVIFELERKLDLYISCRDDRFDGLVVRGDRPAVRHRPNVPAGPLRISVAELDRHINFKENCTDLTLRGYVKIEPRLPCVACTYPRITRAVDEDGRQLKVHPVRTGTQPFEQIGVAPWKLTVGKINPESRHLKLLEGTVSLELVLEYDVLTVKDILNAQGVEVKKGAYRVKVDKVKHNRDRLTLDCHIRRSWPRGQQSRYDYYYAGDFRLVDDGGKELSPGNVHRGNTNCLHTSNFWGGSVYFRLPDGFTPVALRFRFPTRTTFRDVPFRMQDVPAR